MNRNEMLAGATRNQEHAGRGCLQKDFHERPPADTLVLYASTRGELFAAFADGPHCAVDRYRGKRAGQATGSASELNLSPYVLPEDIPSAAEV